MYAYTHTRTHPHPHPRTPMRTRTRTRTRTHASAHPRITPAHHARITHPHTMRKQPKHKTPLERLKITFLGTLLAWTWQCSTQA